MRLLVPDDSGVLNRSSLPASETDWLCLCACETANRFFGVLRLAEAFLYGR